MSCFIVQPACLIDVYTLIKKYKPELIGSMLTNEFINKLAKLNCDAFAGRYYGEENRYTYVEYPIAESTRHELTMFFNFISFNYQCDEDPVCYTDFYNQLDKLEKDLMTSFATKYLGKSEGYEKDYSDLRQYMKDNNIDYFWGK